MNVVQIKLKSGDNIVAVISGQDDKKNLIRIMRPYRIITFIDEDSRQQVMLFPWAEMMDPDVEIPLREEDILCLGDAREEAKRYYAMHLRDALEEEKANEPFDLAAWEPETQN